MARKSLQSGLSADPQAAVAAGHLRTLTSGVSQAGERLDVAAPIRSLVPSAHNPRRISLDAAGVTAESIENLRYKSRQGEKLEDWLARQDRFLEELVRKGEMSKHVVWSELFELAISVLKKGLLQPIVARPDGEIIGGERRYTACLLADIEYERVIFRAMSEDMIHAFRLIENLQRAGLSIAETVMGARKVLTILTQSSLGPDNQDVTADVVRETMGCKQTQAYYYYTLCRLTDDDPLLLRIVNGEYTSLRTAYEDASKYLKSLRAGLNKPLPESKPGTNQGNGSNAGTKKPSAPQIKVTLPGTVGGKRIIAALNGIDGISSQAAENLSDALSNWEKWDEKVRKKKLMSALSDVIESLIPLDAESGESL